MGQRAPVFRPLQSGDAAGCAWLHAQAFSPSWTAEDFRDQITRPDRVLTAAVAPEPRLVGFAASRIVAGEADLLTIVIDRAARRGGAGAALLARHLSMLARAGATSVFLEVGHSNMPARALYARFGFVQVGLRQGYYASAGMREDALLLRLDLG